MKRQDIEQQIERLRSFRTLNAIRRRTEGNTQYRLDRGLALTRRIEDLKRKLKSATADEECIIHVLDF